MWWNTMMRCEGALNVTVEEDVSFDPGHLNGLSLQRQSGVAARAVIGTHPLTAKLPHNSVSGSYVDITVTSNLDVSFAASNGLGGLDTGSVASDSDYEVWLIAQAGGLLPGLIFIKVGATPSWPADYVFRRYLTTLRYGTASLDQFDPITSDKVLSEV